MLVAAPGPLLVSALLVATSSVTDEFPIGLAISGGVSLGAYESGASWAFLRLLKSLRAEPMDGASARPRLDGVTGGSAGAINALALTLAYCATSDGAGEHPADALLREAWIAVGLDGLLPPSTGWTADADSGRCLDRPLDEDGALRSESDASHCLDDGVLTRRGFASALELLDDALNSTAYYPRCQAPTLSFSVTPVVPFQVDLERLEVPTQRGVVSLQLRIDEDGRPRFTNNLALSTARAGQAGVQVALPTRSDGEVANSSVVLAAMASSAFPGAFSPVHLRVCIDGSVAKVRSRSPLRDSDECPNGWWGPYDLTFSDGGVFDNIPLDPLLATAQGWDEKPTGKLYASTVVYFDPDLRRHGPTATSTAVRFDRSVGSVLDQVLNWVGTAQRYELTSMARYDVIHSSPAELLIQLAEIVEKQSRPESHCWEDGELANVVGTSDSERLRALARDLTERLMTSGATSREIQAILSLVACMKSHHAVYASQVSRMEGEWLSDLDQGRLGANLFLADRFPPLTGNQLRNFGAFFATSFREYDRAAGVYDALVNVARFVLRDRRNAPEAVGRDLRRRLGLDDAELAEIGAFAKDELERLPSECPDEPGPRHDCMGMKAFLGALATEGAEPDATFARIHEIVANSAENGANLPIEVFLDRLRTERICDEGGPDFGCSTHLRQAIRPEHGPWWGYTARKALWRLRAIEKAEGQSSGTPHTLASVADFGTRVLSRELSDSWNIDWSPSTVPNSAPQISAGWYLIPYRFGVNAWARGLALGWEFRTDPSEILDLRLGIEAGARLGDRVVYAGAGLAPALKFDSVLFRAAALGPYVEAGVALPDDANPDARHTVRFGGQFYVDFMADLLRVDLRYLGLESGVHREDTNRLDVLVFLTDIPGLLYWFVAGSPTTK